MEALVVTSSIVLAIIWATIQKRIENRKNF